MKVFKGRFRSFEEIEKLPGDNYRSKSDKRMANKTFRKTGKNLIDYDVDSIYVPKYNQRHGWGL